MNYKWIAVILMVVIYLYRMLISVLSLMSEKNPIPENVSDVYDAETYANLSPSPLVVKLEYSHPTLSQRIDAIRKLQS
jgi:hypothetical protein